MAIRPPSLSYFVLYKVTSSTDSPSWQKALPPDQYYIGKQDKVGPGPTIPSCALL